MKNTQLNNIRLSTHFRLGEFLHLDKYPDRSTSGRSAYAENIPTIYQFAAMVYGCQHLLEPAREAIGCPIIINSGFRNPRVNALVGGVRNSQHLLGQAADIRPKDPQRFQQLVYFLRHHEHTDQLLTGPGWLHISWKPFSTPRHDVRIGYYK